MTVEQKAKAYDEAIKEASIAYKDEDKHLKATLERIFPVLRESEDEKIRKELIKFVKVNVPDEERYIAWLEKQESYYTFEIKEGHWYKCVCDYMLNDSDLMFKNDRLYYCRRDWRLIGEIDGLNVKNIGVNGYKSFFRPATNQEIKDWLEKQGEPNPYSGVSFKFNDHTWGMCARDGGVEILIDSELKAFVSLDKSFIYPIRHQPIITPKSAMEAINEQKVDNANKVEPNDYSSIDPHFGKPIEQKPADKVEPKFHEGDWTVSKLDKKARQISEVHFDEYNSYYVVNGKSVNLEEYDRLHHLWTIDDAKDGDVLAAHECIVLFKEIDGLNIKCHCTYHFMNNPSFYVNTLQNKSAFHPATKEQRDTLEKAMVNAGYTFDFDKKELKKIEQSKLTEFEEAVKDMMDVYRDAIGDSDATIEEVKEHSAYLQSLIPQTHAWSEEDEEMWIDAIKYLELFDAQGIHGDVAVSCIEWLKSLKEKYAWNPSDEQMKALKQAKTDACGKSYFNALASLYVNLKR